MKVHYDNTVDVDKSITTASKQWSVSANVTLAGIREEAWRWLDWVCRR